MNPCTIPLRPLVRPLSGHEQRCIQELNELCMTPTPMRAQTNPWSGAPWPTPGVPVIPLPSGPTTPPLIVIDISSDAFFTSTSVADGFWTCPIQTEPSDSLVFFIFQADVSPDPVSGGGDVPQTVTNNLSASILLNADYSYPITPSGSVDHIGQLFYFGWFVVPNGSAPSLVLDWHMTSGVFPIDGGGRPPSVAQAYNPDGLPLTFTLSGSAVLDGPVRSLPPNPVTVTPNAVGVDLYGFATAAGYTTFALTGRNVGNEFVISPLMNQIIGINPSGDGTGYSSPTTIERSDNTVYYAGVCQTFTVTSP